MLSSFSLPRIAGVYGQRLLSTRLSLHSILYKPISCVVIANIHSTRKSEDYSYELMRRGTRSAKQTRSRQKWTPEEDNLLETLYNQHGPKHTLLASHFANRSVSAIYSRCQHLFRTNNNAMKIGPWDKDEADALRRLTMGTPEESIDWKAIQLQLPQLRHIYLIKQTWYHSINPKWNHGRWTKDETEQLLQLVGTIGDNDWCRISDLIGCRSPRQCLEKYRYQVKVDQKGRFTAIENAAILDAVREHGAGDFMLIKRVINSQRTPRQISQHYRYALDPAYDRSPWSQQEKMELYNVAKSMGSSDMIKIREQMNSKRHPKDMRNNYLSIKRSLFMQDRKETLNPTKTPSTSH